MSHAPNTSVNKRGGGVPYTCVKKSGSGVGGEAMRTGGSGVSRMVVEFTSKIVHDVTPACACSTGSLAPLSHLSLLIRIPQPPRIINLNSELMQLSLNSSLHHEIIRNSFLLQLLLVQHLLQNRDLVPF